MKFPLDCTLLKFKTSSSVAGGRAPRPMCLAPTITWNLFRIFGSTTDSCKHYLAWQATLYICSTKQPCYALAVCILLRAMYHNLANTMKMNYLILFMIYVMHRVHSSIIALTNVTILTTDYA